MLATAAFIASHQEYPTAFGLGSEFQALVALWRAELLEPPP
jgi:hypothetical protein